MKFDDILRWFGYRPWFDFEMVLLVSGEAAPCVHTELYRWRRAGKLLELRRGLFVLAEPWRHGQADGATLAGPIYAPSYLTGRWSLAHAGIFKAAEPTSPVLYPSATTRPAREFENAFGVYRYDTLPRDLLFGTKAIPVGNLALRTALPEKALLDLCFFEGGEWDAARFRDLGETEGCRGWEGMDAARLLELAARTGRPRLARAARAFARMAGR